MYNILFGIPVYKTKINPDSFDKDLILNTIEKNYQKDSNRNHYDKNSNIHLEYNDRSNNNYDDVDYTQVNKQYKLVIDKFFTDYFKSKAGFKYDFFNCNYTAGLGNQSMSPHNHLPKSDFSCVHYLKFDKEHTSTTFLNPSDYADYFRYLKPNMVEISDMNEIINSYMNPKFNLKIEEDDFIIFPSIVKHMINKVESEKLRVTLATDIVLEKLC